jgi:hypothetical protein
MYLTRLVACGYNFVALDNILHIKAVYVFQRPAGLLHDAPADKRPGCRLVELEREIDGLF